MSSLTDKSNSPLKETIHADPHQKSHQKLHDNTLSTEMGGASQDTLPSLSNLSFKEVKTLEEKSFLIYENQRWWPGRGWKSRLLPGERSAWSDNLGTKELKKEDFLLPGEKWEWTSDWTIVFSEVSDSEGWEYASRFKKFSDYQKKKELAQPVRRRKWMRSCALYED